MDMILGKCNFQILFSLIFSLFSVTYFVGTHWKFQGIAFMRQFQCIPTAYVFSINEFFTISVF